MSHVRDSIRSTAAFVHLRTIGRVKGSLTYEDVAANLPTGVTASGDVEAWVAALIDDGIAIEDDHQET